MDIIKKNIYLYLSIFYIIISIYIIINYNLKINSLNNQIDKIFIDNSLLKEELDKYKKIEKEKLERQNYIDSLDLESDYSLQKFVNSSKSFNDKKYIPNDLVNIFSDYVYDTKSNTQLLRNEANKALQKLAEAFYNEFEKKIIVVSAYRSYDYQKGIKDRGCPDNLCSKAGYSEHQSGLALDFWETTTDKEFLNKANLKKYFEWLGEKAHTFGFHNTYQKGLEIDGYEIEPWHWRYMGEELASYLKENNITIAEYYNKKINKYGKNK